MKVLFIGSNPDGKPDLAFERDITALQKRLTQAIGLDVSFEFLPSCPIEELPQHLRVLMPDIVHFAAHGGDGKLYLADQHGTPKAIGARMIKAFVNPERPPVVVYLSACDSAQIAEELARLGLTAIGATQAITNGAARASTVCFYDRLISGFSIAQSHDAAKEILSAMNADSVEARLYVAAGHDVNTAKLVKVPRIVAEPTTEPKFNKDRSISIELRLGVMDYPRDTVRIAFFSPDISFEEEGFDAEYTDNWYAGVCWCDGWYVQGDFVIVAAGASPSQRTFCEVCTAVAALENCLKYKPKSRKASDDRVRRAIDLLSGNVPSASKEYVPLLAKSTDRYTRRANRSVKKTKKVSKK